MIRNKWSNRPLMSHLILLLANTVGSNLPAIFLQGGGWRITRVMGCCFLINGLIYQRFARESQKVNCTCCSKLRGISNQGHLFHRISTCFICQGFIMSYFFFSSSSSSCHLLLMSLAEIIQWGTKKTMSDQSVKVDILNLSRMLCFFSTQDGYFKCIVFGCKAV